MPYREKEAKQQKRQGLAIRGHLGQFYFLHPETHESWWFREFSSAGNNKNLQEIDISHVSPKENIGRIIQKKYVDPHLPNPTTLPWH